MLTLLKFGTGDGAELWRIEFSGMAVEFIGKEEEESAEEGTTDLLSFWILLSFMLDAPGGTEVEG